MPERKWIFKEKSNTSPLDVNYFEVIGEQSLLSQPEAALVVIAGLNDKGEPKSFLIGKKPCIEIASIDAGELFTRGQLATHTFTQCLEEKFGWSGKDNSEVTNNAFHGSIKDSSGVLFHVFSIGVEEEFLKVLFTREDATFEGAVMGVNELHEHANQFTDGTVAALNFVLEDYPRLQKFLSENPLRRHLYSPDISFKRDKNLDAFFRKFIAKEILELESMPQDEKEKVVKYFARFAWSSLYTIGLSRTDSMGMIGETFSSFDLENEIDTQVSEVSSMLGCEINVESKPWMLLWNKELLSGMLDEYPERFIDSFLGKYQSEKSFVKSAYYYSPSLPDTASKLPEVLDGMFKYEKLGISLAILGLISKDLNKEMLEVFHEDVKTADTPISKTLNDYSDVLSDLLCSETIGTWSECMEIANTVVEYPYTMSQVDWAWGRFYRSVEQLLLTSDGYDGNYVKVLDEDRERRLKDSVKNTVFQIQHTWV